jgi:hypothetical protein
MSAFAAVLAVSACLLLALVLRPLLLRSLLLYTESVAAGVHRRATKCQVPSAETALRELPRQP